MPKRTARGARSGGGGGASRIGGTLIGVVLLVVLGAGLLNGTLKFPGTSPGSTVVHLPTFGSTAAASTDTQGGTVGSESAAKTLAELNGLPIKGKAPKAGYSRDQFGPAWADVDHNGCDTRDDVLGRDLTNVVKKGSCTVLSGLLHDPYTGHDITFTRGNTTSTAVQIDHRVALSDAWQTGAAGWDAAKREAFANDPANLLAVDGPTNEAKGDGDAATWLPPNKAFRCQYVTGQVQVKVAYGLWVTQAEHDAIATVLASCH